MMRRLFAVWPPGWALVMAGLVYCGFQGMFLFQEWFMQIPFFVLNDAGEVVQFVTLGFAAAYAFYRVAGFHPGYRAGYYLWLKGTPWHSRRPLPLGPIHLVWQDAVLLAIVFAAAYPRSGRDAIAVVQIFLVVYVLSLGGAHYWTGEKVWGYATQFAAALPVLFVRDLYWFAGTMAFAYVLGYIGLRVSLAHFPWDDAKSLQKTFHNIATGKQDQKDAKQLGWPYDRLGPPSPEEVDVPFDVKFVLGVLIAWWFFVGYQYFRNNMPDGGYLILYGYMVSGIISRVCTYCIGYAPPISILGRLANLQPIVPGYDWVIVSPVAAFVVGVVFWYVPGWLEVPPIYVTPTGFILIWWILMAMPPSLRQWRLTGNHRVVPGVMSNVQSTQ
jgi:hypothetical protein